MEHVAKSSVPRLQVEVHNLQEDPHGFRVLGACLQRSPAQEVSSHAAPGCAPGSFEKHNGSLARLLSNVPEQGPGEMQLSVVGSEHVSTHQIFPSPQNSVNTSNYSRGVCRNIQLSIHHFLKSPLRIPRCRYGPAGSSQLILHAGSEQRVPEHPTSARPQQLRRSEPPGAAAPRLPSAALQWLRSQRSGAM